MADDVARVFVDTNVYIVGATLPGCPEEVILGWLNQSRIEVIISRELIEQVSRVARRLQGKDWSGEVLSLLWGLNIVYVEPDDEAARQSAAQNGIPREDIELYLAARAGQAQCFVSANHELVRALAERTGEFECLTPEEFVARHIHS